MVTKITCMTNGANGLHVFLGRVGIRGILPHSAPETGNDIVNGNMTMTSVQEERENKNRRKTVTTKNASVSYFVFQEFVSYKIFDDFLKFLPNSRNEKIMRQKFPILRGESFFGHCRGTI